MGKFYKTSILLVLVFVALSNALDYSVLETAPSAGLVPQDFAYDVNLVKEHSNALYHKLYFQNENTTIKPEYRFHISIERGDEVLCGGAVIKFGNRQYIITAASCGVKDTDIVRVNSAKALKSGAVYPIKCVVNHPRFRSSPGADPHDNDVAIVYIFNEVFAQNNLFVRQFAMPKEGQITTFAHFSKKIFKNTLVVSNVVIYSRQECEDFGFELTNNIICAGHFDLNTSFCNVDHGSPLFDQRGVLLGIKSWGVECSRITLPSIYTNIPEMYDWIYSTLRQRPVC